MGVFVDVGSRSAAVGSTTNGVSIPCGVAVSVAGGVAIIAEYWVGVTIAGAFVGASVGAAGGVGVEVGLAVAVDSTVGCTVTIMGDVGSASSVPGASGLSPAGMVGGTFV